MKGGAGRELGPSHDLEAAQVVKAFVFRGRDKIDGLGKTGSPPYV